MVQMYLTAQTISVVFYCFHQKNCLSEEKGHAVHRQSEIPFFIFLYTVSRMVR